MSLKTKPLKYLCTVYSSHPKGLFVAYEEAAVYLGILLQKGERVFCPISHCHTASKLTGIPPEFDWWMDFDEGWIDKCDGVIVAMMPGWQASRGITHEIEYARSKGMTIEYLDVETMQIVEIETNGHRVYASCDTEEHD